MRNLFERHGYEEYIPPMLERAEIYGWGVAIDPTSWIEDTDSQPRQWDETVRREFLPIEVTDFQEDKPIGTEKCILRPEGTASLCRYIALNIANRNLQQLDELKVYYIIPCFRNEDVSNLSSIKQREFNQIGLEFVGTNSLEGDVEVFSLGYQGLAETVRSGSITARVSDVNIFRKLSDASNYDVETRVRMKGLIDGLSKARTLGMDTDQTEQEISGYIKDLSPDLRKAWTALYSTVGDEAAINEIQGAIGIGLEKLRDFFIGLREKGVSVSFDPSMIRGWEYYNGVVCQYDVTTDDKVYAEVSGGGRYDKLIGNFLTRYGIKRNIPATGFAYGTERLVEIALGERDEIAGS